MARKTFAEYKAAVVHALGAEPASGIDKGQIVNDALQHLASLRSWKWRRGGPVSLGMVADQSYVELPQDFGEEVSLTFPGSIAKEMVRTTMAEIEQLRASAAETPGFTFFYAINSGSLDDAAREEGLTVNLIELYPTPGSTDDDAFTLVYRRNVDLLDEETDVPQIPPWMDFALFLLCRSFAMTLEDDNAMNASQQAFDRLLPDLIKRDAQTTTRYGVMAGGLFPKTIPVSPFYPTHIADPT